MLSENFILSLYLWLVFDKNSVDFQFVENREWLSGFINYKVGIDGISILFIILTTFITPICIISVNATITNRLKDFLIAILIMETFMIGVFCSLDLVVFYLFFEAGLIPMFLIIGIWGGERRVYSAFKFFLFTLLGSVLMLVAIIAIYWITGTTDVTEIYKIQIPIAIRQSLPAYGNEIILMMKGTSLASTVTLMDLTGVAKYIISTTFKPIEVFIVAGGIYLFMTFIIHNVIKYLEKKYSFQQ